MKSQLRTSVIFLSLLAVVSAVSDRDDGDDLKNAKIIGASYQTTTFTALSTFVTIQPYFCAVIATAACEGRRLRRRRKLGIDTAVEDSGVALEDSLSEEPKSSSSSSSLKEEGDPKAKFFFTVWQTTTTTATVTSTSYNTSITLSASAFCSFPNYNVPQC